MPLRCVQDPSVPRGTPANEVLEVAARREMGKGRLETGALTAGKTKPSVQYTLGFPKAKSEPASHIKHTLLLTTHPHA